LDSRLNFKTHVKKSIDKANAIIKKRYPLIVKNNKMAVENKILLYKTMIRPVITYAAPVWCHLSKSATEPLEVFQNKCLRLANNAPTYTSTEYLRNISGVPKIREHITETTEKFFSQRGKNKYIDFITDVTTSNIPFPRIKHGLIHQNLSIFR
jgi:hypothetical protein